MKPNALWGNVVCVLCILGMSGAVATDARQNPAPLETLRVRQEAEKRGQAGKWGEAVTLWQQVVEQNPHDGAAWSDLAQACYQAKEYRRAIPAYEKVIALGAGYRWSATYDIACCYALMGEKKQALDWLELALNRGFRDLRHVQTDADLKSLHEDPRFRALAATEDVSKMSRVEGWRYDLKLLAREIKRIHYSPFRKVSEKEFNAYVQRLHTDIPRLSDAQIAVRIIRLAAMIGDGHTTIRPAYHFQENRKALPVQFYLFQEGLFVTAAAPAQADLAGAQVLRIGDRSVEEAMEALRPLVSQDNTMWPNLIVPLMLRFPQALNGLGLIPQLEQVTLTVRDTSGTTRTVTLDTAPGDVTPEWVTARKNASRPEPLYLKEMRTPYWFEYLPDSKMVYCQYNAVQNRPQEPLTKFSERLFDFIAKNPVERLVIDMRWNGGGNNFLNRPLVHGLIRCDKINQKGKLFVIVGRNTFSAAMNGATDIERHTNAIFVGEPTGSSPNFVGESIPVHLPYSKMRGTISDLYWQSSVAMDYRTWIAPLLYAPPTFALYRDNRDPAMEAILAYPTTEANH